MNLRMKKKIVYTDEPMGDLEVVADFLPSPAELAFREDGVKVTLALGQIDSKCETSRLITDNSYLQSTDDQV
jgi:hypothetical protein